MSMRNVRRMFGDTNPLPPLEGNSDEEFEPLYAKDSTTLHRYAGLEVSSNSNSEDEMPEAEEEPPVAEKPKKKKNNKKKKQQKRKQQAGTSKDNDAELDEIDKSVMEVNAILGSPPPAPPTPPPEKKVNLRKALISVQAKHLDYNNELKKIFGSECIDDTGRGKKYRPHNVVKYKRAAIVPIPDNKRFHSVGLSMSLNRRENGISYFTFDHNREYQRMHHQFIHALGYEEGLPYDDSRNDTHIEALLESADFMFRAEEYTAANTLLESIISYLHYVAHPCFNLTDQSIRLEYKYIENRPFHIVVLKYCHMLTNKACHRTALELAKLLLNLDPSDPLAVIYVIDVIALRAREHQWLIDAIQFWSKERDAGFLFNMQYSNALAHYHVAKKNKSNDFSRADELLQNAMLLYPTVTTRLLECCKHGPSQEQRKHEYFLLSNDTKLHDKIKTAMMLYAKLVCWRWREPDVMTWFYRNFTEVIERLNNDPETQSRLEDYKQKKNFLLGSCPFQVQRHLQVVRFMSNLLVEWELPNMMRQRAWDPLPPTDGIDRYGYGLANQQDPSYYSGLFNIFSLV